VTRGCRPGGVHSNFSNAGAMRISLFVRCGFDRVTVLAHRYHSALTLHVFDDGSINRGSEKLQACADCGFGRQYLVSGRFPALRWAGSC
jgi:hypothetical protein